MPATTHRELQFRRLEVKYHVDQATRTALTRDLAALMPRDAHAGESGGYLVRSLYFDTPDYLNYHQKLAGAAIRHKLRVRVYGEGESRTHVRYEVKSRYMTFINKVAVDVPMSDYVGGRHLSDRAGVILPFTTPGVSQEFFRLQRQYNMVPKVLIQYRRHAFERRGQHRVRVNFDDDLMATRELDLLGPLRGARRLQQYGHAIFEIKVDDVLPQWLHMLIAKYDLQASAISKYCYGVRSEARLSAVTRGAI